MARKLSDEQLQGVADLMQLGKTREELAAKLEVTPTALKAAMQRWRERGKPVAAVDPVAAEQARQQQVAALRTHKALLEDIASEQNFRAVLSKQLDRVVPKLGALKPQRVPGNRGAKATESLMKMWSDWHAGERVDAERMRGFNEYNFAEFMSRLERDTTTTLHLAEMMGGGGWRFEELVMAVLGDLVTGTAHDLEKHSDPANIVECVVDVAGEAALRLQQLAAAFPKVRAFWLSGNHGRLPDHRRMAQKEPMRNWDAMIGLIVQRLLAKQSNVTITVPNSYAAAFMVQGHTFLGQHGHDIKQWNSIPFYGINRYVTNINALEAARNNAIQYFLFAHFHRQTSLTIPAGEWFINGSLIGGNEFSLNVLGASDRPSQWMMAVHRKWGVTHRWPVFSTPAVVARPFGDFVYDRQEGAA